MSTMSPEALESGAAPLRAWRALLRGAALINIGLWVLAYVLPDRNAYLEHQLWLSAMFVAGCAFRSCYPVVYLKRHGFDTRWTSSVFVGRSVATVAELAFAL